MSVVAQAKVSDHVRNILAARNGRTLERGSISEEDSEGAGGPALVHSLDRHRSSMMSAGGEEKCERTTTLEETDAFRSMAKKLGMRTDSGSQLEF